MDKEIEDNLNQTLNSDLSEQLNDVSIDETTDLLMTDDSEESTPEDDAIGDTVFSKHFLFNTLMKIIKVLFH